MEDGEIREWRELDVGWDALHDEGSEAAHHARVVRVLRQNRVDVVVVHHMGEAMSRMLATMGLGVVAGAEGDARAAVAAASHGGPGE